MEKDLMINSEAVKVLRKNNGWSQEQLAKASGLSLRTIQRVEAEGKASLETKVCLAATLKTHLEKLDSVASSSIPARFRCNKIFLTSLILTIFLSVFGFLTKTSNPIFFLANIVSIFGTIYISFNWYFVSSAVEKHSNRYLVSASFIYVALFSLFAISGDFGATIIPSMLFSLFLFSAIFYMVNWVQKNSNKQHVEPDS